MEHTLFPEIAPSLSPNINERLHQQLNVSGDPHDMLYNQHDLLLAYGLVDFTMDNSYCFSDFEPDWDVVNDEDPRTFTRGILFAMAVADCWLSAEELECLNIAATEVATDTAILHEELQTAEVEGADWPTVLMKYGQEGLDRVPGFRDLVETWVWAIESEQSLHGCFAAGAGLMLCVMLAAKQVNLAQEVDVQMRPIMQQFGKDLDRFIQGGAV